jgi:hypothetical protein
MDDTRRTQVLIGGAEDPYFDDLTVMKSWAILPLQQIYL